MLDDKFSSLNIRGAPKILVEPPGPRAKELLKLQGELEGSPVLYPHSIPLVPELARGATIQDVDGNLYIDLFAGIAVLNFGHSNPYILEKVKKQLEKLIHTLDFPTAPRLELVKRLVKVAPGELKDNAKVIFGGPTGSDAVEAAIKLAKYYTKRHGIIAFEGSYHGQTSASLAISSTKKFKDPFLPLISEVHFLPYAYCYRCVFDLKYPKCNLQCAKYIEHILEDPYSGLSKPAAIIVEPVQGEGGIIVPPNDFLVKLRDITRKYDILLIVDEIQTGFGRTGKIFASEYSGISPDIMTVAKAIGGIGLPLSAVIYNKKFDVWESGAHLGTFRGHVLAMVAGAAAIDFMLENDLTTHVEKIGNMVLNMFKDLSRDVEYIGDVRGKGLMIGVEFVKDRETKEPFKELLNEVQINCFKRGVLVWKAGHYGNVLRLLPPLVITEDLMQKSLDIIEDTILDISKEYNKNKI